MLSDEQRRNLRLCFSIVPLLDDGYLHVLAEKLSKIGDWSGSVLDAIQHEIKNHVPCGVFS